MQVNLTLRLKSKANGRSSFSLNQIDRDRFTKTKVINFRFSLGGRDA